MTRKSKSGRRGALLVEFALIALVFYLLISIVVDFGRMMYVAQSLQDAARVAARELAVTPLPADATFEQALVDPAVQLRVFDPALLVIDLDTFASQAALDAFLAALPAVNQALRPVMIYERVNVAGADRNLLRYPGALLSDPASPSGLTVGVPRIASRDANGVETIEWVPILGELRTDPADPLTGPFSATSASPQRGMVAVVINYPFQAAATSSFRQNPAGPFEPNIGFPNQADDGAVTQLNAPAVGTVQPVTSLNGTYAGPFGLGRQLAMRQELRPFRRLVTAQALYRREVFQ